MILTGLAPTLYAAMDVVSQGPLGFIQAVTMDARAARAAQGDVVKSSVAAVGEAEDIVPAMTVPNTGSATIGSEGITITKARQIPITWTGEQSLSMNNGIGVDTILRDQFVLAMNNLAMEIEADLAALYIRASRATGTAGTTPFASNFNSTAQLRRILTDNGAPLNDMQLVINTLAAANLRSQAQLTKANEAGTTDVRARGTLIDLNGFAIRESSQIANHTAGSGSGYLVNHATYPAESTDIAVDTGTGTVVAGDVLAFANDTEQYVTGTALSGGVLSIAQPGLRKSLANNAAITLASDYVANMGFARSAIRLATRAPAIPQVGGVSGDAAVDRMMLTDPMSGLSFEVAVYMGFGQVQFRVGIAWGMALVKPEHCALLLG